MDVLPMPFVIANIVDTMVRETLLPDQHRKSQLLLGAKRKPAFNELNGLFQRYVGRRRNQEMGNGPA